MQPFLRYLRFCNKNMLIMAMALFSYTTASFAQTPPPPTPSACTSYTSACPSEAKVYTTPPGCTQDGYPAFNGPADAGSIDGAPCPGQVWSVNGTNTFPSAAAAGTGAFETDQGDGASGYECFELAVRYWKYRFAIDINSICRAQGDCSAQDLQNLKWPSTVTVYPMPASASSYTPVCGDLVSYNNADQHVDVVTSVSGSAGNWQVTTLNQNTGGWDPWATGIYTNPIGAGTSNFSYIHVNANTSSGTTCSNGTVIGTSSNARAEPFALVQFATGISTINDANGNINIFTHNSTISNADQGNQNFAKWQDLNDNNAAYDPVASTDQNMSLNVFYFGEDNNIWHDYQTDSGSWPATTPQFSGTTPQFTGAHDIIDQYQWVPYDFAHHITGHFEPLIEGMPTHVTPASNLNVMKDDQGLNHIVFFGTDNTNPSLPIVNLYESVQYQANDEYNTANVNYTQNFTGPPAVTPPVFNLYTPISVVIPGGNSQLYCSSGASTSTSGPCKNVTPRGIKIPQFLAAPLMSGYPTIFNSPTSTGVYYLIFRSDDIDVATNNRGSIWYSVWNGHWGTPHQIRVTTSGGTVIPVTTSNISAAANPDGRIELFYRGADQALWHMWQTSPNSNNWSAPVSLGDVVTSDPVALYNANVPSFLQVMQVFYRDSVGDIKTLYRYHGTENIWNKPSPQYAGTWSCRSDLVNSTSNFRIGNLADNNVTHGLINKHTYDTSLYWSYPEVSIPAPSPFVNSRVAIGYPPNGQLRAFFVGVASPSGGTISTDLGPVDTNNNAVGKNNIWLMWQYNVGVNQDCIKGPQSVGTAAAVEGGTPATMSSTAAGMLPGQSGVMTDSPTGWMGGYTKLELTTCTSIIHTSWTCSHYHPGGEPSNWLYEIPFPQSIGGEEDEAPPASGVSQAPSSSNAACGGAATCSTAPGTPVAITNLKPDAALCTNTEQNEAFVPHCYPDPERGCGAVTFGFGTFSQLSDPSQFGTAGDNGCNGQNPCTEFVTSYEPAACGNAEEDNILASYPAACGATPFTGVKAYDNTCLSTPALDSSALNCALNLVGEYYTGEANELSSEVPGVQLTQCQFDGIMDIAYNTGAGSATVIQILNYIKNGQLASAYAYCNSNIVMSSTSRQQSDCSMMQNCAFTQCH